MSSVSPRQVVITSNCILLASRTECQDSTTPLTALFWSRHRASSYPTAPAQITACGTTALDFSDVARMGQCEIQGKENGQVPGSRFTVSRLPCSAQPCGKSECKCVIVRPD